MIGRIVGWSIRSRGVVLAMAAAAERLSPLLLTTLATAPAVVPLVARGVIPGREFLQPWLWLSWAAWSPPPSSTCCSPPPST